MSRLDEIIPQINPFLKTTKKPSLSLFQKYLRKHKNPDQIIYSMSSMAHILPPVHLSRITTKLPNIVVIEKAERELLAIKGMIKNIWDLDKTYNKTELQNLIINQIKIKELKEVLNDY